MMKISLSIFAAATLLSGCAVNESITKFVDAAVDYQLVELDGLPFVGTATIAFPETGRVEGQAPCNRYFAQQSVPYPWFAIEGIGATRMACPDLALETEFFEALEGMTLAEVSGDILILSNSVGRRMIFETR